VKKGHDELPDQVIIAVIGAKELRTGMQIPYCAWNEVAHDLNTSADIFEVCVSLVHKIMD
jgi:hypothetical protein